MTHAYPDLEAKAQRLYQTAVEVATEHRINKREENDDLDTSLSESEREVIRQGAREDFAHVPRLFSDFAAMPAGDGWDAAITGCDLAMHAVAAGEFSDPSFKDSEYPANSQLSSLATAAGAINEWTGEAAVAFIRNHVLPFGIRMSNIFNAIAVLKAGLEAMRELWTEVPNNLDEIAKKAQNALDNCYECNADDWEMALKVLSLIGTFAAPITSAAGVAKAADLLSDTAKKGLEIGKEGTNTIVAIGAAGGAVKELGGDRAVSGGAADTPEEVIRTAEKAIKELKERINEAEQAIADGAAAALARVESFRIDFIPPAPSLAQVDQHPESIGRPSGNPDPIGWS